MARGRLWAVVVVQVFWAAVGWAAKSETLIKAREAAIHDEWEQVAQLAQQAVTENADDDAAWALLADAQMALGDTTASVISYEKALHLNPRLPSAILALTAHYLKQDRIDHAERIVAAAEEKDKKGKYDEIKVARGQIFARQGDMAEATKILASATAKNPRNPLYPQILARIYEDRKVYALAERYYAEAWALAPGEPTLAYEYGLVLQEQKKYDEALNLFKVVQTKDPSNKTVDYLIGRLYYAARRWAEAATQFEKAVEKRPDHFLSHYLLGKSYQEFSREEKKNFYPLAEKHLRRAHDLKPDRKDVQVLLAEVVFLQGKIFYQRSVADTSGGNSKALLDSSLMLLHESLRFNPEQPGAFAQMARAWNKLGNLDSCVSYSKRQLQKTPHDETEFARLINALQRKKDQTGLIEVLQPEFGKLDWTTSRAPDDTSMSGHDRFIEKYGGIYANALIETGKYASARDVLKQMLTYNPQWCDGHNLNAYMELKRENYAGAIPLLQAGVRHCPKDADLWVLLGDSYYFADPKKKDNVQKAKEAYERACALGNRDACHKREQLGQ